MKRHSLALLALAVFGLCVYYTTGAAVSQSKQASPAKSNASVEQELIRLEEEGLEASLKQDARKIGEMLADDYFGINFEGQVEDKAKVLEVIANPPMKFDSLKNSEYKVSVLGEVAIVTALTTATGPVSGQARFTDVWVKRNGKWKLLNSQGTLVQGTVTGLPKQQ